MGTTAVLATVGAGFLPPARSILPPMGTLLAKLLLPTLSSLALLPTISVAAKRRFHMEAMVYLFTMFFLAVSLGSGAEAGVS